MKILAFVAFALAVAAADDSPCYFDPQVACNNCPYDRNFIQYVADSCNISTFYFCEKNIDGVIIPHQLSCGPCLGFSNDKWSCSIILKTENCPTPAPPVIAPAPTVKVWKDFFCVNFDGDNRDMTTWYDVEKTQCALFSIPDTYSPDDIYQQGLGANGRALYSAQWPCSVEIPFFQNNEFDQFTMCGFFNFFDVTTEAMGLAHNGFVNDCFPGSINVFLTTDRTVTAEVVIGSGTGLKISITNSYQVSPWIFHKYCFQYDGIKTTKVLTLTVDGNKQTQTFKSSISGKTQRLKCNMRLGQTLEADVGGYWLHNFIGVLDSFCFTRSIVNETFFLSK